MGCPLRYESQDQKTHIWFERMAGQPKLIGNVFLSEFSNCVNTPKKVISIDRTAWQTDKSVGLGSTLEQPERAHGKILGREPRWLIAGGDRNQPHPEFGDVMWSYAAVHPGIDNDLRIASFGISKGRVVWIYFSHNE